MQGIDGTGGDPKAGGWVLSKTAMDALTGGRASELRTVRAYVEPVGSAWCPVKWSPS